MLQALDHGKPATPEPRRKAAKAYKVIKWIASVGAPAAGKDH
jgi:hypothetical protein